MAKTQQGAFDFRYHHIDAPTIQDDDYGREHKKRILTCTCLPATFRDPLVGMLRGCPWVIRRKLDGANIRIQWDGEQALWNGKTNNFQCGARLTEYMNNTFLEEIFEEKFGRDVNVVIFGEHMGPKVQGNELDLDDDQIFVYDVNINGFWQPKENVREIASYFGCLTCYDVMWGRDFNDNIVDYSCEALEKRSLRDIIMLVTAGRFKTWEGIVATPEVECRNQKGERVIVKVKTKDYYRGE